MDNLHQAAVKWLHRLSWVRRLIRPSVYVPLSFAALIILKQFGVMVLLGLTPGPSAHLATLALLLALLPWVRRARPVAQALWYLGLDLFMTLLIYGDLLYFRQFSDLTSVASLKFAGQLVTVGDSVTGLMQPADLWLWLDLPVLALVARAARRRLPDWLVLVRPGPSALTSLVGVAMLATIGMNNPFVTSAHYYGHSWIARTMGILNYHLIDLANYTRKAAARLNPSTATVAEVQNWFATRHRTAPTSASVPQHGIARGKNAIILQVESLQAFPLGLKVGGQEVTPNLNRLMAESVFFANFYHQTGQGATADADLLANCSLLPIAEGAVYYEYPANDFRCMPTLLRENGYTAVAMQGMPPDFWNLATVYPRIGFERYFNLNDFAQDDMIGLGLSDESFLRQVVGKLKQLPEPYYAFVVTLTSHAPFAFDGLPQTLDLGALAGTKVGDYLQAVHYTDAAIGHFVERLRAEGILDRSVLMVYGDHLGVGRQASGMADLLQIPADQELAWVRAEKRVPFLVRLPGGAHAGVQQQAAGEADIAPTLAGLLGIPTDRAYLMGRDLFATQTGVVALADGSAVNDQYYYRSAGADVSQGTCYAIATGARVPPTDCTQLAQVAAQQLRVSRLIIEQNLIEELTQAPTAHRE
jgi:lipoteichoic acid synthase